MPALIVRYFLKNLPDGRRGAVERHLAACSRCRGKLLALRLASEIMAPPARNARR
jgi:anti-sigma factor RsiW